MAQTRACAKVLRTCLAWVVVLAGYEPTPAEEMPDPEKPKAKKAPPTITATPAPAPRPDFLLVMKVEQHDTKRHGVQRYKIFFSDGTVATTIKDLIGSFAHECWKQRLPVRAEIKSTEWGPELVKLERNDAPPPAPPADLLTSDDIPF
jgi:hypothetical protein